MTTIKITLLLILIGLTANAQLKKISTLTLLGFPARNDFYYKFEVRNNFIYLSVDDTIRKIDLGGQTIDSLQFICKDNSPSNCTEFEVAKKDKQGNETLYYSLESCQLIGIADEFQTIKKIDLHEIFVNKAVPHPASNYGFCIDENKNIYVRHSGAAERYDSNQDVYLTIIKKDTIVTKLLPPKAFLKDFKVHDSVAVSLTSPSNEKGDCLFFININTFDSIRSINIHQKLGLKKDEQLVSNRLISFDGSKCLFVASRYKSDIDYIVQVDLSTLKFEKILQIGNVIRDEKYYKAHKIKPGGKGWGEDPFAQYPNRRLYSYENGKLFVLYESKKVMCIDTYKFSD